jgi:hypothetical protein
MDAANWPDFLNNELYKYLMNHLEDIKKKFEEDDHSHCVFKREKA